jgi:glycopeptide antibiotics resistance protein
MTRRRWPAPALAAYAAFLVVATLAPFEFTSSPLFDGSLRAPRVEWIPFTYVCPVHGRACLHDRLVNVVLFLPFGGLAALVGHGARRGAAGARRIAAAAFALSLGVEIGQLFLPSRFPSTADVALNTLGAWLGAAIVAARAARPADP